MMGASESVGKRWKRRAVSIPVLVIVAALYLGTLPLLLPVAAVFDVLGRRRFAAMRALLALALYVVCEVAGLLGAAAIWVAYAGRSGNEAASAANYRLQNLWARTLLGGAMRIFAMRARVEGDDVLGSGPILLFVRHASTVDTLLAANFVAPGRPFRLRYVIKHELLWDPCLDVVGLRIPNAFIRRGSGEGGREIEAIRRLARDLGPRDGVLIYPEGTRATPEKIAQVVARIESVDPERAARVRAFRHVLPPRYGGPLGLIEERPDVDVVILTHTGFDGVHDLAELWRGALIGRELRIRFRRVAAASIPGDRAERERWLDAEWQRVDADVDELHRA